MQINKLLLALSTLVSVSILSSCGGGGAGGTNASSGGSTDGTLSIQSISTIDSLLGTKYAAACVFNYGNTTVIVKTDGSGTGVALNTITGWVTSVTGLPAINSTTGDTCLVNFAQLTWYNNSNTSAVNIYNPSTKLTSNLDLRQTGIFGSTVTGSSFMLSTPTNTLYANNNFLGNSYAGLSKFDLSASPITTFTNLPNTGYSRQVSVPVLFGFWGIDGSLIQMYPANITNNQPAILVSMTSVGGGNPEQQTVQPIVDASNQPISAMSTAWDMAFNGQGVIVTTGGVQPVIYNCPASSSSQYTKICTKSYTTTAFTSKYRIMRLLGANSSKLYFMGIDLANRNVNIFSMGL